MKEFASLLRWQYRRMEEKTAFAHVSPALPCPLQAPRSTNRLTALRLWQMRVGLSIAGLTNSGYLTKEPTGAQWRGLPTISYERGDFLLVNAPHGSHRFVGQRRQVRATAILGNLFGPLAAGNRAGHRVEH